MIVICDFDGTITLQDVSVAILDHFTAHEWRDLLKAYREGEIGHFDIMKDSYVYLKTPLQELLDYVRQKIAIRPNFEALVKLCEDRNWPLAVVSGGIDFYIRAFLDETIAVHSYLSHYDEHWRVRLPEWPVVDFEAGQDFKVRVIEELQLEYPGVPVAFIGDGRNDWAAAQHADYTFTVKSSQLARLSEEGGLAHTNFTDFAEVIAVLEKLRS